MTLIAMETSNCRTSDHFGGHDGQTSQNATPQQTSLSGNLIRNFLKHNRAFRCENCSRYLVFHYETEEIFG